MTCRGTSATIRSHSLRLSKKRSRSSNLFGCTGGGQSRRPPAHFSDSCFSIPAPSRAQPPGMIRKGRFDKNAGLFGGRVEIIVGRVVAFCLRVTVRFIASLGWRFAAAGVDTLNGGYVREQSLARMSHDIDQQPGNGIGIWGIHVSHGLTRDFAAVFQFPFRPGEMAPDQFVFPNPSVLPRAL